MKFIKLEKHSKMCIIGKKITCVEIFHQNKIVNANYIGQNCT